jgi:Mg2+/Co2+ transporter CorB
MELYWLLIILAVLFVWGSATALKALDRYAIKKDKKSDDN